MKPVTSLLALVVFTSLTACASNSYRIVGAVGGAESQSLFYGDKKEEGEKYLWLIQFDESGKVKWERKHLVHEWLSIGHGEMAASGKERIVGAAPKGDSVVYFWFDRDGTLISRVESQAAEAGGQVVLAYPRHNTSTNSDLLVVVGGSASAYYVGDPLLGETLLLAPGSEGLSLCGKIPFFASSVHPVGEGWVVGGQMVEEEPIHPMRTEMAIWRLDAQCTLEWSAALNHPGNASVDETIGAWDSGDGGVLVVGTTYTKQAYLKDYAKDRLVWLAKLDSEGKQQWERQFAGNLDMDSHLVFPTREGGLFVATPRYATEEKKLWEQELWIASYDRDGNESWSKTLGRKARSVDLALPLFDGGVLLSGFYGVPHELTNADKRIVPFYVARLDVNGVLLWEKALEMKASQQFATPFQTGSVAIERKDGTLTIITPSSLEGRKGVSIFRLDRDGEVLGTSRLHPPD